MSTEAETRVSTGSRSSSENGDNWHVVSRSASSTLVPTIHTLASAEQIQTSSEQTRTVSFQRNLSTDIVQSVSTKSVVAGDQ